MRIHRAGSIRTKGDITRKLSRSSGRWKKVRMQEVLLLADFSSNVIPAGI